MMDIQTKEQFLKEYDKLTKNVNESHNKNFLVNLEKWFDNLQDSNIAPVKFIIDGFMNYSNFYYFYDHVHEYFKSNPSDPFIKEKRQVFHLVDEAVRKSDFYSDLSYLKYKLLAIKRGEYDFNVSLQYVYPWKFKKFSESLREIFVKCLDLTDADPNVNRDEQRDIPASDRIVKINHNAPEYQEIIEKLEELENSIRKSNSIENEDKDRLQAELKAGEGILKGKTARIEVIKTLLVKGLKYIIKHVTDAAIAVTAEYLLKLICQYFGLTV